MAVDVQKFPGSFWKYVPEELLIFLSECFLDICARIFEGVCTPLWEGTWSFLPFLPRRCPQTWHECDAMPVSKNQYFCASVVELGETIRNPVHTILGGLPCKQQFIGKTGSKPEVSQKLFSLRRPMGHLGQKRFLDVGRQVEVGRQVDKGVAVASGRWVCGGCEVGR